MQRNAISSVDSESICQEAIKTPPRRRKRSGRTVTEPRTTEKETKKLVLGKRSLRVRQAPSDKVASLPLPVRPTRVPIMATKV
jgi:hypothetical protein